jgi:hypothetical protein
VDDEAFGDLGIVGNDIAPHLPAELEAVAPAGSVMWMKVSAIEYCSTSGVKVLSVAITRR